MPESRDREISKEEFKNLFFHYGVSQKDSGWTSDYWDKFFENEKGKRYFFTVPDHPEQNRMFIDHTKDTRRIYLLTEEAEESLFDVGDEA